MARLTVEVDLYHYRDSGDGSVHLYNVQRDINNALDNIWVRDDTLVTSVAVKHYDTKVGTLTVNLED